MKKLVFAVLGIFFLLLYSSCGDVSVRTVKIYNDVDTTLVCRIVNYPANDVKYSCKDEFPMYRVDPGDMVECTVELYYNESFYLEIFRDLTGDKRDLNIMNDCSLKWKMSHLKEGLIKGLDICDEEMQGRGYVLILDSLTLGLKSPE